MAYVYRHIRLDKNEPFYIGIGSQDNYSRANTSQNRNKWWHHIVNISGYEVDIILDDVSWELAQQKEVEFIKLYGRKQNGGTLCNLTDGGGGSVGLVTSESAKQKQRIAKLGKPNFKLRGRKRPKHLVEALANKNRGRAAWNKGLPITAEWAANLKKSREGKYLTGENHPMFGTKMPDWLKKKLLDINKGKTPWNKGKGGYKGAPKIKQRKQVLQYDLNMVFIKEFDSALEAAKSVNTRISNN